MTSASSPAKASTPSRPNGWVHISAGGECTRRATARRDRRQKRRREGAAVLHGAYSHPQRPASFSPASNHRQCDREICARNRRPDGAAEYPVALGHDSRPSRIARGTCGAPVSPPWAPAETIPATSPDAPSPVWMPTRSATRRPLALEANRFFVGNGDFYNLPRKFKVCITGCRVWCAYPEINDVGLTAVRRAAGDSEVGFSLRVGGGLSTDPHLARPAQCFCAAASGDPGPQGRR